MNSHPRWPCQTSWWVLAILLLSGSWRTASAQTVSPTPPPWQTELDADHALQASLSLMPAQDAARRQNLALLYRQLATRYPDAAPVQKAVGNGLADLESPSAALPYWLQAEKLDPQDAELADTLGSAYLQLGQVRPASERYQRAVDLQPSVAAYHTDLANVLYLFRRQLLSPPALPDQEAVLRLALTHFRRAAELSPRDLPLAKAYAETFYIFAKPDWNEALAAWQSVRALSGEHPDFANLHLARVSIRLGHRTDAQGYLTSIQDPAYTDLKAKLMQQAAKLDPGPSPVP